MTSLEPTRMTTPQFISPEELEDDTACAVLSALTGEWRTTDLENIFIDLEETMKYFYFEYQQ